MPGIDEPRPQQTATAKGFALWELGFRPFYLLASSFAALSILLWICQYSGHLPAAYVRSPAWHGHEMLYGYALAVVAGFLLTAVRNWTARPTPSGAPLVALAALWVAGRVLVLTPFATAAAIVNAAFPVAVAVGIGIPIVESRNRRNYFFIALLVLLGAAVLAFHLAHLGMLPWPERASLQVGLDVVLFIVVVMGGRVIPMFTNNGVPGVNATRRPWVEKFALGGVLVLIAVDLLRSPAALVATVALFVAAACAEGPTVVTGAAELRVKESDRLAAMATGLRTLGLQVDETPDGATIHPGQMHGGSIQTHHDHRISMAFVVAGQRASGQVQVNDVANVATSFPGFDRLARESGFGLEDLAG